MNTDELILDEIENDKIDMEKVSMLLIELKNECYLAGSMAGHDRQTLEQQASEKVSAYNFYELQDNMDITTDDELVDIINGKELTQ